MGKLNILLIFFLFSFSCYSQNVIQLRVGDQAGIFNQENGQCVASLSTINTIFSSYNIGCGEIGGSGYIFSDEEPYGIIRLFSDVTQINQVINDLNQIPEVINASVEEVQEEVNYNLMFSLVDDTMGNYIETVDGIVQTSSPELNAVFQAFNVNRQESINLNLYNDIQYIRCNCNIVDLKIALSSLTSVVQSVNGLEIIYLLGNPDVSVSKTLVYPNPFSVNFNIDTTETISNYLLVDVSGKEIVATNSKQKLDNATEKLNTGIYLLKLIFDDGKIANYKLVKN